MPMPEEFYALSFKTLGGERVNFEEFRGKRVLIVNSALRCEYIWQLSALQELQFAFPNNLRVILFHSSQFSGDGAITNSELIESYKEHLFIEPYIIEDSQVKGEERNPLFSWLYNSVKEGKKGVEPQWNFWKFVVDENGVVVGYFTHLVNPLDKSILDLLK